jgi:hypothetical protein
MAIDMASVYAERFRKNPNMLRAAVMGQSPDPKLDSYTALNALRLIKEADMMAMAGQARQPTSSPSILAETLTPPTPPQGLAGMMPMGAPAGQMPQGPRPAPQAPVMQAASGGLASMPMPEEDYAEGGIVAFQSGGLNAPAVTADPLSNPQGDGEGEQDDYLAMLDELEGGEGSPAGLSAANKLTLATARRIASRDLQDLTPEERKTMYAEEYKRITDAAGPNPYAALRADLAEQGKERAGALDLAKGEALLQAASDVLEGSNAIRGIARGGARFAKVYGEAQRADKAAKRSMAQMEFSIADAERKERAGNSRAASAAVENARKDRRDMNKAELDRDIALGRLSTEMGKINKPARAAGAGGANLKDFVVGPETYLAQIKEEHPEWSPAKQRAEAFKAFQQGKSAGLQGAVIKADTATAQLTFKQNEAAQKALDRHKMFESKDWRKAVADAGGDKAAAEAKFKQNWILNNPVADEEGGAPAPKPAAPKPTAAKPATVGKVATMADVKATALASKKTEREVMDALEAKGYTIK